MNVNPKGTCIRGARSLLLSFMLVHLTGCVGYTYSTNNVPLEKRISLDGKYSLKREADSCGEHDVISGKIEPYYLVKPKKPPEKVNPDGSESYVVKNKKEWCGLTIFAVIPIPLWLPTCESLVEVTYKDEKAVSLFEKTTEISNLAVCSPLMLFAPLHGGRKDGVIGAFCYWD